MNAPPPPPNSPPTYAPVSSWPWRLEMALGVLIGICATVVIQSVWQKWGVTGLPAVAASVPGLDLNRAEARELAQVPGLGPKRAQKIVGHRETHGPFVHPEDVQSVKGIAGRTAERVRKHLQTDMVPVSDQESAPPSRTRKSEPVAPIDLNRASGVELQQIPGIGPVLAQRILEYRMAHGPFREVKELTKVKGIKERTLEKLLPFVCVGQDVTAMQP